MAPIWQTRFTAALRQRLLASLQQADAAGRIELKKLPAWVWGLAALGLCGLGLLVIDLLSMPAPGAPAEGTTGLTVGIAPGTSLDLLGMVLDVLFKLGLVLGLMFTSLGLINRWRGGVSGAHTRQINRLETLRLSPRQALHLVEVHGQTFLIGATDQELSLLAEVDPQAPAGEAFSSPAPEDGSFLFALHQAGQAPEPAQTEG